MNAIHVRKHIDSELVHAIPELRDLLGQDAEITVRSCPGDGAPLETLDTFLGDALNRPAPSEEEIAAVRAAAAADPVLASALDFAETVQIDVDAMVGLRADSRG